MTRREWLIGGALALVLILLIHARATLVIAVFLGYWIYRDAKARRVPHPAVWAIGTPLTWPFMVPVYLATRPLKPGEVRSGGTWWNILRGFAATYAVGAGWFSLHLLGFALIARAWGGVSGGSTMPTPPWRLIGMLTAVAVPALSALGVGLLLRTSVVETGPTGPLAPEAPGRH